MQAPTGHVIHRGRLGRAAVPAGAALVLLAALAQQEPLTATPFTQPEFVEADCSTWFGRTRGAHVDCGYLSVREDRARPDGNVIRLAVARLRRSVPSPRSDPVIYLAGGPGESAVDKAGNAFGDQALIADTRFIWEERDLILLDQRGVGRSEPRLECPDYRRERAELPVLDLDPDELQREVDALLACKRTLSEQGIDLSAYTPQAIAADVVDLAAAMGYQTYNLYGSSFGTMLALTVMRDFPDHLRSVVLDGVWPPQVNAAEARHANAASALEALFRRCEADPECSRRYPDLEREFWQVVDRYTAHPTTIPKHDGDSSGWSEVEVDRRSLHTGEGGGIAAQQFVDSVPAVPRTPDRRRRPQRRRRIHPTADSVGSMDSQLGGVGSAALPRGGELRRPFPGPRGSRCTPRDWRSRDGGSGSRPVRGLA